METQHVCVCLILHYLLSLFNIPIILTGLITVYSTMQEGNDFWRDCSKFTLYPGTFRNVNRYLCPSLGVEWLQICVRESWICQLLNIHHFTLLSLTEVVRMGIAQFQQFYQTHRPLIVGQRLQPRRRFDWQKLAQGAPRRIKRRIYSDCFSEYFPLHSLLSGLKSMLQCRNSPFLHNLMESPIFSHYLCSLLEWWCHRCSYIKG